MTLLKDIEDYNSGDFQFLIILENTKTQVQSFNSEESNTWSDLRKYFKMNNIEHKVIAECDYEKLMTKGDDIIIGEQCRKLSKKLKMKESPTIIYVDEKGEIKKTIKGYFADSTRETRLQKLLVFP